MNQGRKADAILQALLTHRTIKEAATAARVSERSMYNYLDNPAFYARYAAARDDVLRGVSNNLREQMNEAVDTISKIMRSTKSKPHERLAAAKAVLEYGIRYVESDDILSRISKLEQNQETY
jgi:hypothetical protein